MAHRQHDGGAEVPLKHCLHSPNKGVQEVPPKSQRGAPKKANPTLMKAPKGAPKRAEKARLGLYGGAQGCP